MIKKIINGIGKIFIVTAVIFFISDFFVIKSNGKVAYDLFGFSVPNAPVWSSYIPYLGAVIGFIYNFFSIHGIVGLAVFIFAMWLGFALSNFKMTSK